MSEAPRWYVMNVLYQDKYVEYLNSQIQTQDLASEILEIFVPVKLTTEVSSRRNKRVTKVVKEYILPKNYVLLRVCMNERIWHVCRDVSYAIDWLKSDGVPYSLNDQEVITLKDQCGIFEPIKEEAKANFVGRVGNNVRLVNHIFGNQEGVIVHHIPGDVQVRLTNGFKLQVSEYQVELINDLSDEIIADKTGVDES